jgi:hypothetical protein
MHDRIKSTLSQALAAAESTGSATIGPVSVPAGLGRNLDVGRLPDA